MTIIKIITLYYIVIYSLTYFRIVFKRAFWWNDISSVSQNFLKWENAKFYVHFSTNKSMSFYILW